jgi:hypothetical protein
MSNGGYHRFLSDLSPCSLDCLLKEVTGKDISNIKTPEEVGGIDIHPTPYTVMDLKSRYEYLVYQFFKYHKIKIEYERYGFILRRDNNTTSGTYTPDFYLPEYRCVIEVKGALSPGWASKANNFRLTFPKLKYIILPMRMLTVFSKFNMARLKDEVSEKKCQLS